MTITEVRKKLNDDWNIDLEEYWIPLSLKKFPTMNVCYFNLSTFIEKFGIDTLNEIGSGLSTEFVIQFVAFLDARRMKGLEITIKPGEDSFYTDENADWVIYITHEDTITFGGNGLIQKIKSLWPEWATYTNVMS